jgi:predicted transcriptional regulator
MQNMLSTVHKDEEKKVSDVLSSISDIKSLQLLRAISLLNADSDILMSDLSLTPKGFYTRMNRLLKVGVIERRNARYYLTSFGKIVLHAQHTIDSALLSYWKLRALDSVATNGLPVEEFNKLTETLIEDKELRSIISQHKD